MSIAPASNAATTAPLTGQAQICLNHRIKNESVVNCPQELLQPLSLRRSPALGLIRQGFPCYRRHKIVLFMSTITGLPAASRFAQNRIC
jgi:hypothetical protein